MSMQDHYCAQPVQEAQEYMPYQERVEAIPFQPEIPFQAMQPMVPEVPANDEADPPVAFQSMIPMVPQVDFVAEVPAQPVRPARPAVLPRRAQPLPQALPHPTISKTHQFIRCRQVPHYIQELKTKTNVLKLLG